MTPQSRIVYVPEARSRRSFLARRLMWRLGVILTVTMAMAGIIFFGRSEMFRIRDIRVEGETIVPASDIIMVVTKGISGRILGLIPRDHTLLVSPETLQTSIAASFPALASVRVETKLPRRLVVSVADRTLWGLYCRDGQDHVPRDCRYIDREGVAYEVLPEVSGWLLPVVYGADDILSGATALSPELVRLFDRAQGHVREIGEQLISLRMGTATPSDITFGVGSGWEIHVSRDRDPAEWARVLDVVLGEEVGERRESLEYVDLRFGNKVFYRVQ